MISDAADMLYVFGPFSKAIESYAKPWKTGRVFFSNFLENFFCGTLLTWNFLKSFKHGIPLRVLNMVFP